MNDYSFWLDAGENFLEQFPDADRGFTVDGKPHMPEALIAYQLARSYNRDPNVIPRPFAPISPGAILVPDPTSVEKYVSVLFGPDKSLKELVARQFEIENQINRLKRELIDIHKDMNDHLLIRDEDAETK